MDHVVGVRERQVLAAGVLDPGVPGRARSAVLPNHEPEPVIAAAVLLGDGAAAVARAVVDQHDLDVAQALPAQ
jgi:formaldehyde-activating enzyme involved in methanogenesis